MVLEKKKERLEREMREIRSARRAIIHTSYTGYLKTLMPSQWKYLPRTVDICAMDPFAAVVDAEGDVAVTAADFEDAFRQLPELISADSDARKLHARSLLKIPTAVNHPASSAPEPGEIVEGETVSVFEFLTTGRIGPRHRCLHLPRNVLHELRPQGILPFWMGRYRTAPLQIGFGFGLQQYVLDLPPCRV
jgi:hypothetical protein